MPTVKDIFLELKKKITYGLSSRLRKDYNPEQVDYLKHVDRLKDRNLDAETLQIVCDLVSSYGSALLTLTECEECGLRADGMTVCKRCEKEVHHGDTDSISGNCNECEEELEELEEAENADDEDEEEDDDD